MSKDPAFLFYHQDFFTGVSDMSNEEVGAYVRCLCIQASKGGITDKHMKNICYSSEIHKEVKNKFSLNIETNLFENNRLKEEILKRKKYSESRSNNRKNKVKKDESIKNTSLTYEKHMENENENENIIDNEVLIKKTKFNFLKSLVDLGIDENLAIDWLSVRKTKKLTNTQTSFNNLKIEFEKSGKEINEIINKCVTESWGGFKASWNWNNNFNNTNQNGTTKEKPLIGRATESVIRANLQGWE
jgi:hypothetical protein